MAEGQSLDHRIIPATDMRSLYRILKEFNSIDFHLAMARETERAHVSTTIAERFRTSVEQFSSYCNVDEHFYPVRDETTQSTIPVPKLPRQIKNTLDLNRLLIHQQNGQGRVLNHPELDFTCVAREIIPTNTAGTATFTDSQPATAAKRIDWLLANRNDQRPIIAEIKVGNDMNPYYALIQTLMWTAELVTFNQVTRLKHCFQDQIHFPGLPRALSETPIALDIYLILCKYDSEDPVRRELFEITERV